MPWSGGVALSTQRRWVALSRPGRDPRVAARCCSNSRRLLAAADGSVGLFSVFLTRERRVNRTSNGLMTFSKKWLSPIGFKNRKSVVHDEPNTTLCLLLLS